VFPWCLDALFCMLGCAPCSLWCTPCVFDCAPLWVFDIYNFYLSKKKNVPLRTSIGELKMIYHGNIAMLNNSEYAPLRRNTPQPYVMPKTNLGVVPTSNLVKLENSSQPLLMNFLSPIFKVYYQSLHGLFHKCNTINTGWMC
jgi:hypothetical protein